MLKKDPLMLKKSVSLWVTQNKSHKHCRMSGLALTGRNDLFHPLDQVRTDGSATSLANQFSSPRTLKMERFRRKTASNSTQSYESKDFRFRIRCKRGAGRAEKAQDGSNLAG